MKARAAAYVAVCGALTATGTLVAPESVTPWMLLAAAVFAVLALRELLTR